MVGNGQTMSCGSGTTALVSVSFDDISVGLEHNNLTYNSMIYVYPVITTVGTSLVVLVHLEDFRACFFILIRSARF